jgi:hypothetical protein
MTAEQRRSVCGNRKTKGAYTQGEKMDQVGRAKDPKSFFCNYGYVTPDNYVHGLSK